MLMLAKVQNKRIRVLALGDYIRKDGNDETERLAR